MAGTRLAMTVKTYTVDDYRKARTQYVAPSGRSYEQLTIEELRACYELIARNLEAAKKFYAEAVQHRPSYAPQGIETRSEYEGRIQVARETGALNFVAVVHNLKAAGKALPR